MFISLRKKEASAKKERETYLKTIYNEIHSDLKDAESKRKNNYQVFLRGIKQDLSLIKDDTRKLLGRK
ncbi:MAG: hypothetical protein HRT61_20805 [Ekhidna sp.]|nr:hypothetical protein [Ekhidna sp.]